MTTTYQGVVKIPPQSERAFQRSVLHLAELFGWRIYHTWTSLHSASGFPDLVLARNGRLIFAELKSDSGRIIPTQQAWLDELSQVPGAEVYIWRPRDIEEIARILER